MSINRKVRAWVAVLMTASAALAGCTTQTNVSMQTSVQSQYTHAWLTIQGVWFNTSATATPDDAGWKQFTLSAPITFDLASLTNGSLAQVATDLKVPAGTYSQMRLIPVDASATLAASASAVGAIYNAEADYADSSGTTHQVPLELLNPDKGVGVSTSLTIKASLSQLGVAGTTTTNSNCLPGDTTCQDTTGTGTTVATTTSSTSTSSSLSVAVTVDGIHDLVQFAYGNSLIGVLLNPHAAAYDVSTTGTIRGTIDTANMTSSVSSNQDIAVQVTAETLSADGSRHVAVKTVQVNTDGSFVLYPLSTGSSSSGSSSTATYDLVIHGPQIATVIIKSVPVAAGDPSSSAAVSIGTVTPSSAKAFTFNLAPGSAALPAGALVNLYQTLPISGDAPYLVDQVPIDPFSFHLLNDESVPTGGLYWGTYVSGGNVTLTAVTPIQGASTYSISAQAPLFDDGALTASFAPPASGTGPMEITMPTLLPATGATGSVSVTVTPSVAGKYDHGELILSHDGTIVQTVAIDFALTQNSGATLQLLGIPAGGSASAIDNAVYYLSVRAWNSTSPTVPAQRLWYSQPVDLSSGSVTGLSVSVD